MSQSDLKKTIRFLKSQGVPDEIDAAVILGSGLGDFETQIENVTRIPYSKIPAFPEPTVEGHSGTLLSGRVEGKHIIAFSGRFHRYEGFSFEETHAPVYLVRALNAKKLLISNAAGAINTSFKTGDLVIIESILRQNLSISARGYQPFAYNHTETAKLAKELISKNGHEIKSGTYLYAFGPNYETKAEIRAFRKMGGDMVGMSTAPELFEASRLGLKTVALSLVTNMAAGIEGKKLSHDEVKATAETRKKEFAEVVKLLIREL